MIVSSNDAVIARVVPQNELERALLTRFASIFIGKKFKGAVPSKMNMSGDMNVSFPLLVEDSIKYVNILCHFELDGEGEIWLHWRQVGNPVHTLKGMSSIKQLVG